MSDVLFVVVVIAGLALSFGLMVWARSRPDADAAWDDLHRSLDELWQAIWNDRRAIILRLLVAWVIVVAVAWWLT